MAAPSPRRENYGGRPPGDTRKDDLLCLSPRRQEEAIMGDGRQERGRGGLGTVGKALLIRNIFSFECVFSGENGDVISSELRCFPSCRSARG